MPLTKAQCPNCGGALEVDSAKEAALKKLGIGPDYSYTKLY